MKTKLALAALAAATMFSVGASAQDFRFGYRSGYEERRERFDDRDDRAFYRRGFDAGYRAAFEHRGYRDDGYRGDGYRNEWLRGFDRDDRRAFDRGFHDGFERARFEMSRRHRW